MHYLAAIKHTLNLKSSRALLLMIFGGFAFATMGALTHKLGENTDWIIIAFFRMLFGFVLTTAVLIKSGNSFFIINRPLLWVRSLVGSIAMLATFYALTRLPISDVAVITETRPIWVALLAGIFLGENTRSRIWLAIVFSLIGVLLIEKPHFEQRNYDVFIVLIASVLAAVVMICLRLLRDLDPMLIVAHFSATASVISLIVLFVFKQEALAGLHFEWTTLLMLIGVGIFGTFGQLAMTKAFALGEASTVAAAGFIKVGFSAVYDILIWKYVFYPSTITGMILILGSTLLLFNTRLFRIRSRADEIL